MEKCDDSYEILRHWLKVIAMLCPVIQLQPQVYGYSPIHEIQILSDGIMSVLYGRSPNI